MRILHAPENIGGMAGVLARTQSALGFHARSYNRRPNHFNYPVDYTPRNPNSKVQALLAAIRFATQFDVFHFYFGNSLLGASLFDLRVLSRLRKKIFFYFCGCDIRDEKATTLNYAVSACSHCFPKQCSRNRDRAHAAAEQYGKVNFVSTPDLLEFVPRSVLLPQIVDLPLIDAILAEPMPTKDPNRFVIAHVPTSRQIKGTQYLIDSVERLRARGYAIDLNLIEGKSHDDALRAYRQADLAVDQVLVGSYGLLAAELMVLGVPTAVYLRPDLMKHYEEDPPLINVQPFNLESVLADWYERRDKLSQFVKPGQEFARRVHDPVRLAKRCLEAYAE